VCVNFFSGLTKNSSNITLMGDSFLGGIFANSPKISHVWLFEGGWGSQQIWDPNRA